MRRSRVRRAAGRARCLVIGGFDPSGGAGVLADLWVMQRLHVEAAAVVTALTAQNLTRVLAVHPLPGSWVRQQIEALREAGPILAIKIGMLGSAEVVRAVATATRGIGVAIVLDPVLRSTAGLALLDPAGVRAMHKWLLPLATVLTPNLGEAETLLERRIHSVAGMAQAAIDLRALGPQAVVVKGGDRLGDPVDVFADGDGVRVWRSRRIGPGTARGTGCRFASAIAAALCTGATARSGVCRARRLVRAYLRHPDTEHRRL